MPFEFNIYYKLIFEKKLNEAIEYRKKFMPTKLYKYVSLSDKVICNKDGHYCVHNKRLDELKFDTLSNNNLWMSRYRNLNDPFEYKAMYLKRNELSNKGWPLDLLDEYINKTKDIYLISSFTANLTDNMAMWAHYSNNHKGYCIEYDVLNPKLVYKISYEEERIGVARVITQIFNLIDKIQKGEIDINDRDYQFFLTLVIHFGIIKHKTWEYENEYRVIHADTGTSNSGMVVPSIKVGLQANRIFIGNQCSTENKDRLTTIANNLGVRTYEMYLDDNDPCYKLSYRPI